MGRSLNDPPLQGKTQRGEILRLLLDAQGSWVPLPDVLALGIAQYNARIYELRRLGFDIENRTERVGGERHSWFRLVSSPTRSTPKLHRTPEILWQDRPRATGLPLFDAAVR
jgi:Helix-turn-helix domain